jgi:uncharacterized membrane protein (DUF485 family)
MGRLEVLMAEQASRTEILNDPDFKELARQKTLVSAVLTIVMLVVYLGYIGLLAFAPQVLATRVSRGISLGIPLGIGVIIVAWILTGIYVRWANTRYDELVARVRAKAEHLN